MGSNPSHPMITGHIEPKGTEYYQMVLNAGKLPDGKRNRISISTQLLLKGNQKKATAMLNDTIGRLTELREITGIVDLKVLREYLNHDGDIHQLSSHSLGIESNPENPLFSEVVEKYLQFADVGENTLAKYTYAAKHIKPYFDKRNIRVKDLTTLHIAEYYTCKKKGDPQNNIKPLAATTLADHKTVIDGAIKFALKIMKVIVANPSSDVKAPKPEDKSPNFFSQSELNEMLKKIQGLAIEPAVIITANYGLRRQEVVGLKWSAVDLHQCTITVRHTVTQVGTKIVCADRTKSKSSLRTLPLTDQMKAYFKKLRSYQDIMRQVYGDSYNDNDYICKWPNGERLRPGYVTNAWSNFLANNNIKHITFHDLRHSAASMLHQLGFSIIEIQEWLGHADITSTQRYVHTGYADKKKIADKINSSLSIPGIEEYIASNEAPVNSANPV